MWFYKLVFWLYVKVVDFNNNTLPEIEEFLFKLSHKWRQEQCLRYIYENRCTKNKCTCYKEEQ